MLENNLWNSRKKTVCGLFASRRGVVPAYQTDLSGGGWPLKRLSGPTMGLKDAMAVPEPAARPQRAMIQTRVSLKGRHAETGSHARRLWASAGAAALAESLTMPVDFAKVRLQLQRSADGMAAAPHHHPPFRGMFDCLARTLRAEGPAALFKGLGPALARQTGYTGLSFLLYEPIRNFLSHPGEFLIPRLLAARPRCATAIPFSLRKTPPMLTQHENDVAGRDTHFINRLVAGGTAGSVGIAILNPMEVLKTQIQAAQPGQASVARAAARIWRTDGIRGFWAGVLPNITRTFLVCAAELGTYDEAKTQLISSGAFSNGPLTHLLASAAAGVASATVSAPVDVVKTRLMSQAGSHAGRPVDTPQQYRGMAHAMTSIVASEGPAALYKGFVPIITRKVLWCSSFFMMYEHLRSP